jgi:alkylresorcinol/alkylpyrone synthase
MFPRLAAVATAVPAHCVPQQEARRAAAKVFRDLPNVNRLLNVFDTSLIEKRYFCRPPEWLVQPHTLAETSAAYIEAATELGAQAMLDALAQAGLEPRDIDYLVYVNTTGLATPSIDARLMNVLGCRPEIAHTPVWGRGCAGGVFGLSHAADYLRGRPDGVAVVVAAEFCGLTLLSDDISKSNLVACALFADGVGAAVLAGAESSVPGHEIVATQSRFFPDSLDVMGWNVTAKGLQVVFNRRIPQIVRQHARAELERLRARAGVAPDEPLAYLHHPGGRKVLEAYEEAYGIERKDLAEAYEALAEYGNMSSATALFVLERFLGRRTGDARKYAAICALGPGFCAESLMLKLS